MPARILFDNGDGLTLDMMHNEDPVLVATMINSIINEAHASGPFVSLPAITGGASAQILIRISDIARVVVT